VLDVVSPQAPLVIFAGGLEQEAMLEAVSDLGILMLLLLTGMETELAGKTGRPALSVSVVLPFVCGIVRGQFLQQAMNGRHATHNGKEDRSDPCNLLTGSWCHRDHSRSINRNGRAQRCHLR